MLKKIISASLALLTWAGCQNPKTLEINTLPLEDWQGNKVSWQDPRFANKLLFVHFWATWCKDCRIENPSIDTLYQSLNPTEREQIAFVFISDEEVEIQKAYQDEKKLPFQFFKLGKKLADVPITYIPQTYLINPKGEVLGAHRDNHWKKEDLIQYLNK